MDNGQRDNIDGPGGTYSIHQLAAMCAEAAAAAYCTRVVYCEVFFLFLSVQAL